jgi:hypothetical protein
LTVTTSANVSRYGLVIPDLLGPSAFFLSLALFSFAMWRARNVRAAPAFLRTVAAATVIVALGLAVVGCGGYGSSTQPNRGTASIMVTAQSGAVSHTTTIQVTVQ